VSAKIVPAIAALANSREASEDTGGAMDRMMWELVRPYAPIAEALGNSTAFSL
jgi:hypothetical protein